MVLRPLPALHVMFAILGVAMKLFRKRMQGGGPPRIEPLHFTPVGDQVLR
jgi:hypothetical protein